MWYDAQLCSTYITSWSKTYCHALTVYCFRQHFTSTEVHKFVLINVYINMKLVSSSITKLRQIFTQNNPSCHKFKLTDVDFLIVLSAIFIFAFFCQISLLVFLPTEFQLNKIIIEQSLCGKICLTSAKLIDWQRNYLLPKAIK